MVKLKKYPNNIRYSEIFQSISLLFAFVNKKENIYSQIFFPVKCRDFLGDCIWSKATGLPAQIYSFSFDNNKTPLDTNYLRMSLTFPTIEVLDNFKNNFSSLNKKEATVNPVITRTNYFETDDPLTLIIEADPIWQSNVWKISLYTYYLKLLCYKDVKELKSPENEYAKLLTPEIEKKFLDNLSVTTEKHDDSIHIAHNFSGFISIIKKLNKEMNSLLLGK
jgi:hypothetical protein